MEVGEAVCGIGVVSDGGGELESGSPFCDDFEGEGFFFVGFLLDGGIGMGSTSESIPVSSSFLRQSGMYLDALQDLSFPASGCLE